jgi:hypothetical protein
MLHHAGKCGFSKADHKGAKPGNADQGPKPSPPQPAAIARLPEPQVKPSLDAPPMGRHWAALQWQPSLDEVGVLPPSAVLAPISSGDHATRLAERGIERVPTVATVKEDESDDSEDEECGEDELARMAAQRHAQPSASSAPRRLNVRNRRSLDWGAGDAAPTRHRHESI